MAKRPADTMGVIQHLQGSVDTLEVGNTYFFETNTKDWVGVLHSIDGPYSVTLKEASWVSESGRLHAFIRDGKADGMEIEPVGTKMIVYSGWVPWPHPLFREAV